MKCKYVLICERDINPGLMVNFVWIGRSVRDANIGFKIARLAKFSRDIFFAPYNAEMADFIRRLMFQVTGLPEATYRSWPLDDQMEFHANFYRFHIRNMSASDAWRMLQYCYPCDVENLKQVYRQTFTRNH